ncbi:MAG: serine/threonine-protein kinase [Planctomycetes bacterium]|nr:serine/threonine-protein kinase [Planctomycetota bacterium]
MASMKFTYRSGQRPLDGYTLKRGVGQGAFGEVYFAVSDGGKEVALKLLRGHTDAELRGVSHCLNLKHPHLVHLYDLRTDARGEQWVIMEYVFGESLAGVVNKHPTGLPKEVVREWFAALARGVGYLHNQGVVHRDLKPANIFIEHGHLKIGDYGLSRRISGSEGGDLSRGVGTPHYMAPEIKNGNYTCSIDVYACGIILYEMLTGVRPFNGETPLEVLMKHYIDPPDLTKLSPAYRAVLGKALEKDPAKRYATVGELAKAVDEMFGARRDAPAVVPPLPPGLTPTLPRAPAPATLADVPASAALPVAIPVGVPVKPAAPPGPIPVAVRDRLTELAGAVALTPLITAACTAPWAVFQSSVQWSLLARLFLLATVLAWAVVLIGRLPKRKEGNPWGRRAIQFTVGACVGALAFWLDGWALPTGTTHASTRDLVLFTNHRVSEGTLSTGMRYLFYFGLAVGACRWWRVTDPKRRERVRFLPLFAAAFWGAVFLFLWPSESAPLMLGVSVMVIASVAAQAASPWAGAPAKWRA